MTKSNEFIYFECLEQFGSHEPFFLFPHQFLILVIRLYLPDFENLHKLIHLNDDSDTSTIFVDSSINDSENSKNCETTPSLNVQGNELEICDSQLKGKFVSKIDITLSR